MFGKKQFKFISDEQKLNTNVCGYIKNKICLGLYHE